MLPENARNLAVRGALTGLCLEYVEGVSRRFQRTPLPPEFPVQQGKVARALQNHKQSHKERQKKSPEQHDCSGLLVLNPTGEFYSIALLSFKSFWHLLA